MRFFILLFLLGLASANPVYDALDSEAERSILSDLELIPSFKEYVALADDESEDESLIINKLREKFESLLEKVKDALEKGETIKEELLEKLKEIREKLKEKKADIGEKLKKLVEKLKEKSKDILKKILEKLGLKEDEVTKRSEDDSEAKKKLRETFNDLLDKIKETMDHGKRVTQEVLDNLKEIREKMKEFKMALGERAKEILGKLKNKIKEYFKNLLDKLGGGKEEESQAATSLKEKFEQLRDALHDKLSLEELKSKIEEIFGKWSLAGQRFLDMITEHGEKAIEKIREWINGVLGETKRRSIKEVWEKVKEYFQDLGILIREKYLKFGEWVKEKYGKGKQWSKDKIANLKEIAKEIATHAKDLSKDILAESLEFFRDYKDDMKAEWEDLKEKVREVLNKKE